MNDVVGTGLIILIIALAVAPFFLLSSAFGAPNKVKKPKDENDGPVIPVPADADGPFQASRKPRDDPDDDGRGDDADEDGDGSPHQT